MMHRVRWAMADDRSGPGPMLRGNVEFDETYVGGRPRGKPGKDRPKRPSGRGTAKAPVMTMVERGGNVRAFPIERVNATTLQGAILGHVDGRSRIMTDEWASYRGIGDC